MGTDAPPRDERQLFQVREICQSLQRSVLGARMYETNHALVGEFISGLETKLNEYLVQHDELVLDVDPQALVFEGEVVLESEKREQTITRRLFLDGLQRISFHDGVPRLELEVLVRLWVQTMQGDEDIEHTFATRFWDEDFHYVHILTLDALAVRSEDGQTGKQIRIDTVMGEILGNVPVAVAGGGESSRIRGVVGRFIGADPTGIVQDMDPSSSTVATRDHFSTEEAAVQAFRVEIEQTQIDPIRRGIRGICQALGEVGTDRVAVLQSFLAEIFVAYLDAGKLREGAAILAEVRASASPVVAAILYRALETADVLKRVTTALQDPARRSDALRLLAYLPRSSTPVLLALLHETREATLREPLLGLLRRKVPPVAALVAVVPDADVEAFHDLVRLLEGRPEEERLHLAWAGLGSGVPAVAEAAFELLERPQVWPLRLRIHPLLASKKPAIRAAVLDALVGLRDGQAARPIAQAVEASSDDEERRRAITALATLGGPEAGEGLRQIFSDNRDPEIRAAAALALGRIGDVSARKLLETEAARWLGPKRVKEACKTALERLDSGGTARVHTPPPDTYDHLDLTAPPTEALVPIPGDPELGDVVDLLEVSDQIVPEEARIEMPSSRSAAALDEPIAPQMIDEASAKGPSRIEMPSTKRTRSNEPSAPQMVDARPPQMIDEPAFVAPPELTEPPKAAPPKAAPPKAAPPKAAPPKAAPPKAAPPRAGPTRGGDVRMAAAPSLPLDDVVAPATPIVSRPPAAGGTTLDWAALQAPLPRRGLPVPGIEPRIVNMFRGYFIVRSATGFTFGKKGPDSLFDIRAYETTDLGEAYRRFVHDKRESGASLRTDRTGPLSSEPTDVVLEIVAHYLEAER